MFATERHADPFAPAYELSGLFFYTNYTASGEPRGVINATFHGAVDGERAWFRFEFSTNHYAEWSYDGTNDYSVVDDGGPRAAVTVWQSEFPLQADPLTRTAWLGLGSAHYFNNTTNDAVLVPWCDWGMKGMMSYQWKMERLPELPHLPRKIDFHASEALWKRECDARIERPSRKFPFREGFLGGRFTTKATQEFEGMTIPTRFSLERYRVRDNEGALLEYSDVWVTNLAAATPLTFRPKISRLTDVSDMRDSTPDRPRFGVIYQLTNDAWLAKDDPKRLALVEAHKPVYAKWRRSLAKKAFRQELLRYRWAAALVLAFGLGIGLVTYLWAARDS